MISSQRFANVTAVVATLSVDHLPAKFHRPVECFAADVKGNVEDSQRNWLGGLVLLLL